MKRWIILGAISLLVLIAAACSQQERAALQTAVARPGAVVQAPAPTADTDTADTQTPEFSVLVTPTPAPTLAGPMGTLTAIADLVASPTQDTEPYVIVNRGNPHFIEFHAWW